LVSEEVAPASPTGTTCPFCATVIPINDLTLPALRVDFAQAGA
jgi:hypothetical protein